MIRDTSTLNKRKKLITSTQLQYTMSLRYPRMLIHETDRLEHSVTNKTDALSTILISLMISYGEKTL